MVKTAHLLYQVGRLGRSLKHFDLALARSKGDLGDEGNDGRLQVSEDRDNVACHAVDRWHFPMLNDRRRNEAFREAIFRHARGKTVVDIGAGCGLLSMYALAGGAAQVLAPVDSESMVMVAA